MKIATVYKIDAVNNWKEGSGTVRRNGDKTPEVTFMVILMFVDIFGHS